MQALYLDIFSGISGDMFLGAMVDLGVSQASLERGLAALPLGGYHLHAVRRQKAHITGVQFEVHLADPHQHTHGLEEFHDHLHDHLAHPFQEHPHLHPVLAHPHGPAHHHEASRDFAQIRQLIADSSLSSWVKEKSLAVFERLAVAEGKVHGVPPEQVHFHEVGAVDSIVDIVGACLALEALGRPRVFAASVVEGSGWVDCAHGRFPIPAPATIEILAARGAPVAQCEETHELVTPTGAALLAEFATAFGPMPGMRTLKVGYGLGQRDNRTRPNVLRAILGELLEGAAPGGRDWEIDTVAVLETNLDDINGEILGQFVERALEAGALDVFHTPIQMKKNRPGVILTVLCAPVEADRFTELMLAETSAFGVRRTHAERRKLRREFRAVPTAFGEVTLKLGWLDGKIVHAAPEFESCRQRAAEARVPVRRVYEAALRAWKEP